MYICTYIDDVSTSNRPSFWRTDAHVGPVQYFSFLPCNLLTWIRVRATQSMQSMKRQIYNETTTKKKNKKEHYSISTRDGVFGVFSSTKCYEIVRCAERFFFYSVLQQMKGISCIFLPITISHLNNNTTYVYTKKPLFSKNLHNLQKSTIRQNRVKSIRWPNFCYFKLVDWLSVFFFFRRDYAYFVCIRILCPYS